jgi:hypothetical protein
MRFLGSKPVGWRLMCAQVFFRWLDGHPTRERSLPTDEGYAEGKRPSVVPLGPSVSCIPPRA